LRLRQTRQRPDPLAGLQIDHLDSIMPTPGLCRVAAFPNRLACLLKVADAA